MQMTAVSGWITMVGRWVVCRIVWRVVVVVVIYRLSWGRREIVCLRKILRIVSGRRSGTITSGGICGVFLTYEKLEKRFLVLDRSDSRCRSLSAFFFSRLFAAS